MLSRNLMLTLALCLPLVSSCSLFASSTQMVAITASEPGAEIFVDGRKVGTGTVTLALARHVHVFEARFEGRNVVATVGTKISTAGVLDIIGGILFLIPLIGLAGPGFRELQATQIMLPIPPAS